MDYTVKNSRSKDLRESVGSYVLLMLETWPAASMDKEAGHLESVIEVKPQMHAQGKGNRSASNFASRRVASGQMNGRKGIVMSMVLGCKSIFSGTVCGMGRLEAVAQEENYCACILRGGGGSSASRHGEGSCMKEELMAPSFLRMWRKVQQGSNPLKFLQSLVLRFEIGSCKSLCWTASPP